MSAVVHYSEPFSKIYFNFRSSRQSLSLGLCILKIKRASYFCPEPHMSLHHLPNVIILIILGGNKNYEAPHCIISFVLCQNILVSSLFSNRHLIKRKLLFWHWPVKHRPTFLMQQREEPLSYEFNMMSNRLSDTSPFWSLILSTTPPVKLWTASVQKPPSKPS